MTITPKLDPCLSSAPRLCIVASILKGGGKAAFMDVVRHRDFFNTSASVTSHNAVLIRQGYLKVERTGPRNHSTTFLALTAVGERKAREHLAALRELMEGVG